MLEEIFRKDPKCKEQHRCERALYRVSKEVKKARVDGHVFKWPVGRTMLAVT